MHHCVDLTKVDWLHYENIKKRKERKKERKKENSSPHKPSLICGRLIRKPMRTLYVEIKWTEQETQIKWKVCFFYSENNKILWSSNMADTFVWEIHEVRKGMWAFFFIVLFGCWLAGQANSDHVVVSIGIVPTRPEQYHFFSSCRQVKWVRSRPLRTMNKGVAAKANDLTSPPLLPCSPAPLRGGIKWVCAAGKTRALSLFLV